MSNTLYFEGAGWVACNDVENCRIRTAFTNLDGNKIYIEFTSSCEGVLWCDFCHYITGNPNIDDCNESRLDCERNPRYRCKFTKKNILDFVNFHCNTNFDEIIVLDSLAGFRVHADGKYNTPEAYNYGDTFDYDKELTRKRREKVEEMKKEFCILFNQKYDNTSYYINNEKQLEVRICVSDKALEKANWTKGRKFIVEL